MKYFCADRHIHIEGWMTGAAQQQAEISTSQKILYSPLRAMIKNIGL
jgi:hypothetical protein